MKTENIMFLAAVILIIFFIALILYEKTPESIPQDACQESSVKYSQDQIAECLENTFTRRAVETKNTAFCERIPPNILVEVSHGSSGGSQGSYANLRDACYLAVALVHNDIAICSQAGSFRERCSSAVNSSAENQQCSDSKMILVSNGLIYRCVDNKWTPSPFIYESG